MLDYKKVVDSYNVHRVIKVMDYCCYDLTKMEIEDTIKMTFTSDYDKVIIELGKEVVDGNERTTFIFDGRSRRFDRLSKEYFEYKRVTGVDISNLIRIINDI